MKPTSNPAPEERPRTSRQRAGAAAEQAAAATLIAAGLVLLDANVRYRDGEIDLVARDGAMLVFVEVRQRSAGFSGGRYGGALASVHGAKQRRIINAAQRYLQAHYPRRPPPCRFDVVAVDAHGGIEWIRQAFDT